MRWQALRALNQRWCAELRSLVTPGTRMADEWACVASVMLAILIAHRVGAGMIGWAAFTAFILLRSDVGETLLRAVLRMAGTALGSALALLIVPWAAASLVLSMLFSAIIGAVGLYGMLTARRGYAWLLFGITFEMILLDRIERPQLDTWWFAKTRMLEVGAGTLACVFVSATVAALAGRKWLGLRRPTPERMHWNRHAARHAAQAGIALATLPALHRFFGLTELAQAGVTVMAVMIVPVAGLGDSGFIPVTRRLWHRAVGCICGGALALVVLLLAHGNPAALIVGTCIGIIIGRHIENGVPDMTYVGLQFTLAVLIVLVPDSYSDARIEPAIERLISIIVGMAVLEPVLLGWHLVAPGRIEARRLPDSDLSE